MYETVSWNGLHVMVVDPNTEIKDEKSGESATITDNTYVIKGKVVFCTENFFKRLQKSIN